MVPGRDNRIIAISRVERCRVDIKDVVVGEIESIAGAAEARIVDVVARDGRRIRAASAVVNGNGNVVGGRVRSVARSRELPAEIGIKISDRPGKANVAIAGATDRNATEIAGIDIHVGVIRRYRDSHRARRYPHRRTSIHSAECCRCSAFPQRTSRRAPIPRVRRRPP